MKEFRVTFGQQYGHEDEPVHPRFYWAHRDGWVTIVADDYNHAREVAVALLGTAWSELYSWDSDPLTNDLFPLGEILRVIAPTRGPDVSPCPNPVGGRCGCPDERHTP